MDESIAQPSPEKLLLAVDSRDPQQDKVIKFITFFPWAREYMQKKTQKD